MDSPPNGVSEKMNPPSTFSAGEKRKRDPSDDDLPYPAPIKKTINHLQINYLVRQHSEDLPLISADDTLPSILALIGDYDGVLQRHESMAGNLGARPLGPILIKRFERLFDGPPRVLKRNGKDDTMVTWLDVVEFAAHKPEQFKLDQTRDGVKVCQFYTKQSRVEISEEDYMLIASGMPQKLIPPQPIIEDEEKELGTLEILEKNLGQIVQMADTISARARQLNHRLKNRKAAIITRRTTEAVSNGGLAARSVSPSHASAMNHGVTQSTHKSSDNTQPHLLSSGFVAVNARPEHDNGSIINDNNSHSLNNVHPESSDITLNGRTMNNPTDSIRSASPATRAELLSKFYVRRPQSTHASSRSAACSPTNTATNAGTTLDTDSYATLLLKSASGSSNTVAIPSTPSSLLGHSKPSPIPDRDDGGPYKAEMLARVELLQKGERILPPCDRCRRLHMDCVKNLTACAGCTRKHAKCAWKEVKADELLEGPAEDEEGEGDGDGEELAVRPKAVSGAEEHDGREESVVDAKGKEMEEVEVGNHKEGDVGLGKEMKRVESAQGSIGNGNGYGNDSGVDTEVSGS